MSDRSLESCNGLNSPLADQTAAYTAKRVCRGVGVWLVFIAAMPAHASATAVTPPVTPAKAAPAVRQTYGIRSLNGFVVNHGQWPSNVRFVGVAGGIEATLLDDAIVLRPVAPDPESGREWPAPMILRLPESAQATLLGEYPLPTRHHFFLGSERARWASDVPGYQHVVYADVVSGIDLVFRTEVDPESKQERFVYDLALDPGTDLGAFSLAIEGLVADPIVNGATIELPAIAGIVEHRLGASWEVDPATGERIPVEARYVLQGRSESVPAIGYEVTGRHPLRALVIDPSLEWATYVGGATQDYPRAIEVDPAGATFLAGTTPYGAPTTPGSFMPNATPVNNGWVGKLSPDGSTLQWATYLGGDANEVLLDLAVDTDGTVVAFGATRSVDFPVTAGAYQTEYLGDPNFKGELFITRLTPDGNSLIWSTFYGGPDTEEVRAVALFPNGDVLFAAQPNVATPDATPGVFDPVFSPKKEFLVRLSADGTQRIFQTYFLATGIFDLEIDSDSNIYFAGEIAGIDGVLPATPGSFKPSTSASATKLDGFIAKMHPMGTHLHWATYFGGESKSDSIQGLAIDAARAVYVVGDTSSADFPVTPGAFAMTEGGSTDGFVSKLLPDGSGLVWSTYLGGSCCSAGGYQHAVEVDSAGNVVSVGSTNESNFPITPDAFQPFFNGAFPSPDLNLTKFDAFGESLIYSTYFGGSGTDYFPKLRLGPDQDPYLLGMCYSSDAPITDGAFSQTASGDAEFLVAKFDLETLPWAVLAGGKKGTKDTPNLAGGGWLTPGSPARLSMRGGTVSTTGLIFVGLTRIDAPVLGGTFVPSPDIIVPIPTNAAGGFDLPFTWPAVPHGMNFYFQVWLPDPGGTGGYSASNAMMATSR